MRTSIVFGNDWLDVDLPERTRTLRPGLSLPLPEVDDLGAAVDKALRTPLDMPSLRELARRAGSVTLAFDDPTVPCYAPMWNTAIPEIVRELEAGGVNRTNINLVCANALHRQWRPEELANLIGTDVFADHEGRIECHDAEDADQMMALGETPSGLHVDLSRKVTDADLTVYLNCSTMRGFSGGWKSICVGLSSYRSIHHHHSPDIMSMSLDRNRMHAMLDEMGAVVEEQLGRDRIFKVETVLANPLAVHEVYAGSVTATRAKVMEKLREHQPARRDLTDEPADVVVYGVPDWSPYAAYSYGNPILDLISTGLGYLGGMIEAVGRPGCTVILATPCPPRWDDITHPSYREVWERVLPEVDDPDQARDDFEPEFARRSDLIEKYRSGYGFHPVHGIMALYPLKRLRHAGRVIVANPADPSVPRHCGFDSASSVEEAIAAAEESHGKDCSIALIEIPPAFNRQ